MRKSLESKKRVIRKSGKRDKKVMLSFSCRHVGKVSDCVGKVSDGVGKVSDCVGKVSGDVRF